MPPSSPEASREPGAGFLAFAAPRLDARGIALRPVHPDDSDFIRDVYATTRTEELRQVPWSDSQRKAFTDWQSLQQERHYATHYPRAERLVVVLTERIGRLYVDTALAEVRLMEVTLLPEWRNRGIGTKLLDVLLDYADALGLPASVHVEPFNPAARMYERAGFSPQETRGLYQFMVRPPRVR